MLMSEYDRYLLAVTPADEHSPECDCDRCRPGEEPQPDVCEQCGGLGQVRVFQKGIFTAKAWAWVECGSCEGFGFIG